MTHWKEVVADAMVQTATNTKNQFARKEQVNPKGYCEKRNH
jgi:hypothetical protein